MFVNVDEFLIYRPIIRIWEPVVGKFLWKYLCAGNPACLKPQVKNKSRRANDENIPKSNTSKSEVKVGKHVRHHKPNKPILTTKYTIKNSSVFI